MNNEKPPLTPPKGEIKAPLLEGLGEANNKQ